jgi:methyltransferase-like protein/2-polyprenyl-3-methyl-5-hydroxy-6-metoxy-1,4-benzoquinol methylase
MALNEQQVYSEIPYPVYVHGVSHPERLAALALLHGLTPPHASTARVLELGCSQGGSLAPFALDLPQASLYGIDLSPVHIAHGNQVLRELGLPNIQLETRDILDLGPQDGPFDYIIAHGVLSWVPPHVADHVFAVFRDCLSPHGIAYVSYNAYPGSYFRDLCRGLITYHIRTLTDPSLHVPQGLALLRFIAQSQGEPTLYTSIIQQELEAMMARDAAQVIHDELSEYHQPFYFHEVISRAAAHGLHYVTESPHSDTKPHAQKPDIVHLLANIQDRIERQQYLDFVVARRFRRSLFCRAQHQVLEPQPGALRSLIFAAHATTAGAINLAPGQEVTFETPVGEKVTTGLPLPKAVMSVLTEQWPQRLTFEALHSRTRHLVPSLSDDEVAATLLKLIDLNLVSIHTILPRLAAVPGERPVASPLARYQARHGSHVASLTGARAELVHASSRTILAALDGTRTRADLLREFGLPHPDQLEDTLQGFAQLGLLYDASSAPA